MHKLFRVLTIKKFFQIISTTESSPSLWPMMFIAGICATRLLMSSRVIWFLGCHIRLILALFITWHHQGILVVIKRHLYQWKKKWFLILIWMRMMMLEVAVAELRYARSAGRILM